MPKMKRIVLVEIFTKPFSVILGLDPFTLESFKASYGGFYKWWYPKIAGL